MWPISSFNFWLIYSKKIFLKKIINWFKEKIYKMGISRNKILKKIMKIFFWPIDEFYLKMRDNFY
jgi:hypothetical protein